jgi:NinB protein
MPNWIPLNSETRAAVHGWVDKAGNGVSIAFKRPNKRTLDQNAMMWPILRAISKKMKWGDQQFTPDQWKEIFMGSLWGAMSVPGIHGGVVFIGARHSSNLTKAEMSELLECILAFAAEHEIEVDYVNAA